MFSIWEFLSLFQLISFFSSFFLGKRYAAYCLSKHHYDRWRFFFFPNRINYLWGCWWISSSNTLNWYRSIWVRNTLSTNWRGGLWLWLSVHPFFSVIYFLHKFTQQKWIQWKSIYTNNNALVWPEFHLHSDFKWVFQISGLN
jgi:hypothetical protein